MAANCGPCRRRYLQAYCTDAESNPLQISASSSSGRARTVGMPSAAKIGRIAEALQDRPDRGTRILARAFSFSCQSAVTCARIASTAPSFSTRASQTESVAKGDFLLRRALRLAALGECPGLLGEGSQLLDHLDRRDGVRMIAGDGLLHPSPSIIGWQASAMRYPRFQGGSGEPVRTNRARSLGRGLSRSG